MSNYESYNYALEKNKFINKIVVESYNEGYYDALESILSNGPAMKLINQMESMTEASYNLNPKDKKAIESFINKYRSVAERIDTLIVKDEMKNAYMPDLYLSAISFVSSAILVCMGLHSIPTLIIATILVLIGFIFNFRLEKKIAKQNEIIFAYEKLCKSLIRLSKSDKIDEKSKEKIIRMLDKMHVTFS